MVEYRQLNKIPEADQYTLPRMDELLNKMAKAKFLPKLDLSISL